MVSGISSTPIIVPNLIRLQRGMGKLSFPVRPNQSLFARFKHITAIPSLTGDGGVSVYKLQMLDNLIEKLVGDKGIGSENIDELISHLGETVGRRGSFHSGEIEVPTESGVRGYTSSGFALGARGAGVGPEPGILLNTFA
jgi:hypothetical protein